MKNEGIVRKRRHNRLVLKSIIAVLLVVFTCETAFAYGISAKAKGIVTPQNIYGVAENAKTFNINSRPANGGVLEYKTSDRSIAKIDAKGNVRVGKKAGTAEIIITEKDSESGETITQKKVKIRVSKYKKANGKLAQSNWDRDRKKGDRRNKDSFVSRYHYKKPKESDNWGFIVRCNDPYISNHAAQAVTYIVNNKYFGYKSRMPVSQAQVSKRSSIYRAVHKAVGDNPSYKSLKKIKRIKKYADTSCTPTLLAGYWLYIDMDSRIKLAWRVPYHKKKYTYQCGSVNIEYHQLEKAIQKVNKEYKDAGKPEPFKIIYVSKSQRAEWFSPKNIKRHLRRGDIVCSCPDYKRGGHTSMML